jgi:hypothetical protein
MRSGGERNLEELTKSAVWCYFATPRRWLHLNGMHAHLGGKVFLKEGEDEVRLLFATTVIVGSIVGAAAAAPYQAAGVSVQNAAAVLNVVAEDRQDVDVTVAAGAHIPAPTVSTEGGRVVIDGGLRNRIQGCGGWFQMGNGPAPVRVSGYGTVPVAELPHITVHVPRTLDLDAAGAVYTTINASAGGRAEFTGCGDATLGATSGDLKLTLNGSGDVRADAIGGSLDATLNGSGDLRARSAQGATQARLNGSGDLSIGDIAGGLDAELHGSGDLRTGAVSGAAHVELTGSGDLNVGAVHGSLAAQVVGSGDLTVASAEGENVDLQLNASGDLDVRGGRAEHLSARNNGSGGVRFAGSAANADLDLHGSGDISVGRADHVTQHDSGSGDIKIGH